MTRRGVMNSQLKAIYRIKIKSKQTFIGFKEAFSAPFYALPIFGCFIMAYFTMHRFYSKRPVSALAILGITIPATFLGQNGGGGH
ncbi:hypothetical protein V8C37DRAFT_394266 [Trichoderma ceciliae]